MRNLILAILYVTALCDAEEFNRANVSANGKILSRKKRYLIFPEGSSLQLVYCLTMPVIGKSTIFTIGGTAALAWELPHDPFQPYRKKAELLHRKDPPGEYIIKDPPKNKKPSIFQKPITLFGTPPPIRYQNPMLLQPIIRNPLIRMPVRFPTIKHSPSYNRYLYHNYQRQQFPHLATMANHPESLGWQPTRYQDLQQGRVEQPRPVYYRASLPVPKVPAFVLNTPERRYNAPSSSNSSPSIYHQVHRRTRRDLYAKIEKFLSAQNKDGRACLLKAICETHQRGGEKGSFMEEIMKAVFRIKPFEQHANEDVYDDAANKNHNCQKMFASCDSSILHFI